MAASDTDIGFANSLTEAGARPSRSIMARRVGSARAWNIRSRLITWLSTHLTILVEAGQVKQAPAPAAYRRGLANK